MSTLQPSLRLSTDHTLPGRSICLNTPQRLTVKRRYVFSILHDSH